MWTKILIFLVLSLFFASPIVGQKKDLAICEEAESKIIQELVGSKLKRRDSYQKDCRFSMTYGSNNILIAIKVFDTEEDSKKEFPKEFDWLTTGIYDPPYGNQLIDLNGRWSDAKGFKTDDSDHFVLLRYHKTQLTLIGSSYDLLLRVEPILRTLNFEAYEANLK
jgi:hypothetical protein